MPDLIKYQVFVSSTYEDLREQRDQVIKAVLEMGHIPVGMEMFSAADEEQWQIIKRHIDESDYYVVIVAHRYGSVTEGISYTRKEYEYAISRGIPVLGFLIDKSAPWPGDRFEDDDALKSLLGDFKSLVEAKPVSYWSSADDLHAKVSIALMKAFNANPRVGWVRASSISGPEVMSELTRLSAENASLRARLEKADADAKRDNAAQMAKLLGTLSQRKHKLSYRYVGYSQPWMNDADEVSLFYVVEIVGPSLIPEYSVDSIARLLALHIRKDHNRRPDIVPFNKVKDLLLELSALGLVEPTKRSHSVKDTEEYWSLTDYGIDFMKWMRRIEIISETERKSSDTTKPESEVSTAPASHQADGTTPVKKPPAKKPPAKKPPAKKPPAKKPPAKKPPAKKPAAPREQ